MNPIEMRDGLAQALERGAEGYSITDLEDDLASGAAMLWAGSECALVTSIHDGPEGRFLHVWLGCGALADLVSLEPGISAFARARGCRFATIGGRRGWARAFRSHGFVPHGGELRKSYG